MFYTLKITIVKKVRILQAAPVCENAYYWKLDTKIDQ
jgi:hypothetical protein